VRGSVEFTSIDGPITGRPVRFGIYLPEHYHGEPDDFFPVLYFLHGLNESCTDNVEMVAEILEAAVDLGVVRPMLVVTPDGYLNSMWADSKSGHKPAETNLVRELMPHIESAFRCMADRRHRVIGGFSMGGYGACRMAVRYPELFNTCFSLDGAMHTLHTFKSIRRPVFSEIFDNDENYFRQNCLYETAEKNRSALSGHQFHMLVGLLKSFNDRFRRMFGEIGLKISDAHYRLTGCGHDAACILEQQGIDLFDALERRMAAAAGVPIMERVDEPTYRSR
jgi:S-formylglutathione hydrolase FrmB